MKIIGLCGGSGSGKGTVAKILKERGCVHIDADLVYHGLVSGPSRLMDNLVSEFGEGIRRSDGGLDRKSLGAIVFGDCTKNKQRLLNEVTHKFVIEEFRRLIAEYDSRGVDSVIVDAPLLFESGFDTECDKVICVTAPLEFRIERIVKRDGISREMAEKRIATQLPDDVLVKKCDFSIINDGDEAKLRQRVLDIADLLSL